MDFVIPPAPVVSLPVHGGGRFPVRRIYCVGRNYAEHAQEMGFTGREPPFFFLKPADAVLPVGEGEVGTMHYPPLTKNLHHEVEPVVALKSDDAARPRAVSGKPRNDPSTSGWSRPSRRT